jgi:hypothetical protein
VLAGKVDQRRITKFINADWEGGRAARPFGKLMGANAGSAAVGIELHTMAEADAAKKTRTGTRTTSATAPVASSKKDRVGLAD